jgi:hypothetical protein
MTFQYKMRPPFFMIQKIAGYDIDEVEHYLELTRVAHTDRTQALNELANSEKNEGVDDFLVDDFAVLDDFATMATEFAVIGLWRSIELYRKRALLKAFDENTAKKAFRNNEFKKQLLKLGIREEKLSCAKSVDELRCLNNAIKHDRRVGGELCGFKRWGKKKGNELGDLTPHYHRLKPMGIKYLKDLTERLNRWWIKNKGA